MGLSPSTNRSLFAVEEDVWHEVEEDRQRQLAELYRPPPYNRESLRMLDALSSDFGQLEVHSESATDHNSEFSRDMDDASSRNQTADPMSSSLSFTTTIKPHTDGTGYTTSTALHAAPPAWEGHPEWDPRLLEVSETFDEDTIPPAVPAPVAQGLWDSDWPSLPVSVHTPAFVTWVPAVIKTAVEYSFLSIASLMLTSPSGVSMGQEEMSYSEDDSSGYSSSSEVDCEETSEDETEATESLTSSSSAADVAPRPRVVGRLRYSPDLMQKFAAFEPRSAETAPQSSRTTNNRGA